MTALETALLVLLDVWEGREAALDDVDEFLRDMGMVEGRHLASRGHGLRDRECEPTFWDRWKGDVCQ